MTVNTKLRFLSLLLVLFSLLLPKFATAQTTAVCSADAIDPDNDGWGWENGASCRVVTPPIGIVYCLSSDSDPDGDGWGWENGDSCAVKDDNTYRPGSDLTTATKVILNTEINGKIKLNESHFYRFEITDGTTPLASVFELKGYDNSYLKVTILKGNGEEIFVSEIVVQFSRPENEFRACLPIGNYYLKIDRTTPDYGSTAAISYSTLLDSGSSRCVSPINTIDNEFLGPTLVAENGTIYTSDFIEGVVTAKDLTGALLWQLEIDSPNYFFPDAVGNVLITDGITFSFVSSQGQVLWVREINPYEIESIKIGESAVIFKSSYQTLRALNKVDGEDRWLFESDVDSYILSYTVTNDGHVVVETNNTIDVLTE